MLSDLFATFDNFFFRFARSPRRLFGYVTGRDGRQPFVRFALVLWMPLELVTLSWGDTGPSNLLWPFVIVFSYWWLWGRRALALAAELDRDPKSVLPYNYILLKCAARIFGLLWPLHTRHLVSVQGLVYLAADLMWVWALWSALDPSVAASDRTLVGDVRRLLPHRAGAPA